MGYSIKIEARGDEEFKARFKKFGATILKLKPALKKSGTYLTKLYSGKAFTSRGAIFGHPWEPLNDKYAAWKAKKFPGRLPLIRSGDMLRGYGFSATDRSLSLFNEMPYFQFHQNGEGVPQRITMAFEDDQQEVVGGYIGDNIQENMEKAGV